LGVKKSIQGKKTKERRAVKNRLTHSYCKINNMNYFVKKLWRIELKK
jgi:hypothetical protein